MTIDNHLTTGLNNLLAPVGSFLAEAGIYVVFGILALTLFFSFVTMLAIGQDVLNNYKKNKKK